MNSRNNSRIIFYFAIVIIAIFLASNYLLPKKPTVGQTTISQIAEDVKAGKVKEISVQNDKVTATYKDNSMTAATKEPNIGVGDYGITPDKVKIDVVDTSSSIVWSTLLTTVLPILLIIGFIWFMLRSAQGSNMKAMNFGKSKAKVFDGTKRTTFNDVAGLLEPKEELQEVVEFLKHLQKFKNLGAEIPKGVLLVGAPGTGKTLLARAVAGEAEVPFFSISASEFVEMFVGVGASRVRDLFERAKKNAPAILFIDELDAIGRQRGSGLGGSHDEREQTLNQILVEMDGFETGTNVIVIAATNRPDVLDAALLRPGRFDRRVTIDLPDRSERVDILKVHTKNKPLGSDIDLDKVASQTAGFSGADLRNVANEAAILAARNGKKEIGQKMFDEAIEKVMMGTERRSRVLSPEEKKITAVHESGHAIVGHLLPFADPIHKISIISRGQALGFTWNLPKEDRYLHSKEKFLDDIATLVAGRCAEQLYFKSITTGASNDFKRATDLARRMVTQYGMSEKMGTQTYGQSDEMIFLGREIHEQRNYSEKVAEAIDSETNRIIGEANIRATDVLKKNMPVLEKITQALLEKESLNDKEFLAFFPKKEQKIEKKTV
jgi:cell division protease FtsH